MAEISNLQESWNGHTGDEVQALITNYLSEHQTSLNTLNGKAVATISAGYKSEDDKTTIVITGYNKEGIKVTESEFKTITEASYTQSFNQQDDRNYECSSIIDTNTDLSIPYDYSVSDKNGTRVAGFSATVTFEITCKGVKKVYTTSTYSSKASTTNRLGTFVIPKSYLGVGTNSITVKAITKVSDTTQTDIWTRGYTTYVADLQLKCTLSGDSFYNLREYDSNFTLNFAVADSAGGIVPETYTVYKSIYINRIGTYYCSQDKLTANSLTTNYNTLVRGASLYASTNVDAMPYIRVLIQAYIIDDNNNKIVSNTVLMDMLNKTGLASDNSSKLYWATMFDNVIMDDSSVTISAQQYDTVNYDFYLYSKTESSYSITVDNETKTSGSVPAGTLTPVNYSYIFRTSGNHDVSLGDFSVTTIVSALATALSEPSGETLSLLASEKAPGAVDPSWGNVCTFSGFDWKSNGWVKTTDDGIQSTALLINNGASLDINYALCDKSQYEGTTYPFTISFKYKIVNGTDESETLISCLSENTGIEIKPQYVSLHTSASIDQSISNDNVHEVTFVYYGDDESAGIYKGLQIIYIDGKYQAVTKAGVFVSHTNTISVKATNASLYLYSVKAYRKGLSFTEVQALYCFNQNDSSKIPDYIKNNNVFNVATNNIGDYTQSVKMADVPAGSKVLVLYGAEEDPTPWLTINSYIKDADEVNKGRIHALKGMRLYVAGKNTDPRNFYAVSGSISAQGTSSMGYPIKNFRIYTNKNAKKSGITAFDGVAGKVTKFYQGDSSNPLPYDFDPEGGWSETELANWDHDKEYQLYSTDYGDSYTSAPANRFCLKADYAESSGTHNTGFARLSNVILRDSLSIAATNITSAKEISELPQQHAVELAGKDAQWPYDVRFNIDGYPIYLFFVSPSYTTSDGATVASQEYYGGRYNMNNDKANTQVFGFEKVTDYFNNDIVKAEGKYIQKLALESGIDTKYAETHSATTDDEFINPLECWEFSSNDSIPSKIGSFYYDKDTAFTLQTDDPDPCDATYKALYWLNGTWEYRFPDLDDDSEGNLAYRRGESKPYLLYKTYQFLYDNNYALNPTSGTLNKFADKVHLYFNVNSIVKYFVLTHAFGAVDQRVKNCMLSFYCDPYGVSAEEAEASPLHYMRGYYIFYDNDTILGLNNAGAIRQPWDFYETDTGTESTYVSNYTPFPGNGIHGIWNNLQKCFELYRDGSDTTSSAYKLGQLVAEAYKNIRDIATDTLITKYLESEQCRQYPDAIHNVDLAAKYLNPNTLRVSSSTDSNIGGPEETPVHLDMAQGTREFHRKNWLNKRLHWLDDLYCATQADSYALTYKTAVTQGADKGTIKLQSDPAFRYWRFYGWTGTNKTLFKATKMLTSSETGTITIAGSTTEYLSNSDAFSLTDLYGCKSIDFSDFTFDPSGVQQPEVKGTFPYLQSFILRTTSGSEVNSDASSSLLNWISLSAMPNLRTLYFCNVKPLNKTYFSELNLRNNDTGEEFTKLETLDLRGTPISKVNLPNSSALTSISLTDPVELSLINKSNISTLNINSDKLNTLTVSGSNTTVYTWALNAAIDNYGTNTKEFTISFGNGINDPFVIDSSNSSLFTLLETLADKIFAGGTTVIKISGNIYTTESYSIEKMEAFGSDLSITSKYPDEGFGLTWGGKDLYEDSEEWSDSRTDTSSCLMVTANMAVSSWAIKVDDNDTYNLNGKVKIVKSGKQSCYIHADPYALNSKYDNKDHKLVVYATLADGTVYNSYDLTGEEIIIYYNPIKSLTLSTTNQYVSATSADITFDFGNHTKKHLLTKEVVENTSTNTNFSVSTTNNASYTWRYTDGILSGASITLSGTSDSEVTFNIWGLTAKITIYYDSTLVIFSSVTEESELYWLRYLCESTSVGSTYNLGAALTKSQASKISICDSNNYWGATLDGISPLSNLGTQDLTYLKYFNLGRTDGQFNIPATIVFSNLETPQGTTQVLWDGCPGDTTKYGTITFGSSVKKIAVDVTFPTMPDNLVFDLSKTKITSIGAYGKTLASISEYVASIQLTLSAAPTIMRTLSLFVYPNTLAQLGNLDTPKAADIIASDTILMFNAYNSQSKITMSSATAYPPLASLDGFTNNIKVGAIVSYRSKGSTLTDWSKVTEVKQAFIYNNNAYLEEGVFTLNGVQKVDADAFYRSNFKVIEEQDIKQLNLNNNLNFIGDSAFVSGSYTIKNAASPSDDIAVFNAVTSIGANAFSQVTVSQKLQFGSNLTTVGSKAFINSNGATLGVTVDIYINKTDALTSVQADSFGNSDNSSNVTIYVPEGSALYTQLTASGMGCKDRVKTYSFS